MPYYKLCFGAIPLLALAIPQLSANVNIKEFPPHRTVLNPAYYNNEHFLEDISLVQCTLENKQQSLCFQLKVKSNAIEDGPYCPETVNDVGGIYPYDGKTNPGLRVLNKDLFEDMEKDGYDIIDDKGNIRVAIFDPSQPDNRDPELAYCIEVEPDYRLKLTYLIPASPRFAEEPTPMATAANIVGLSLVGVPINGLPPSVTDSFPGTSPGNLPALDPCGGHINEGFYHSHMFPETINKKLHKNGITEVQCTNIYQKEPTALIGYAMDGFPIYASLELPGSPARDLDKCNGHFGPTLHYPWGEYHYHAIHDENVDIPRCLKGVLAKDQLIVE
ncbi:YHYH protein [Spartinivicinus ruber]|uniref:YHYH protein n=1 Tax=Spartinivicinus ruber TaxID=2683272 RepID=UPI0013D88DF5|nr:YHYH protein [Spartinivicinus ruber]